MKDNPSFLSEKRQQKTWGDRVWQFVPEHPKAGADGYVLRARVRLEARLGRQLADSEVIRFVDGNASNDNAENLDVREWHRDVPQ